MRVSKSWLAGGALCALLLTGCGGNKDEPATKSASATVAATVQSAATPAASASAGAGVGAASAIPGDPPGSPATRRLDRYVLAIHLPANATLVARQDVTNAIGAQNNPAAAQRFLDAGRETGTLYVIAVDGTPRIQFGINQYATAAGARDDYEQLRSKPSPADALDTAGIGEAASGARVSLGSGDTKSTAYQVAFLRGRYIVSMADLVGDPSKPPDTLIAVARMIDDAIKADPNP